MKRDFYNTLKKKCEDSHDVDEVMMTARPESPDELFQYVSLALVEQYILCDFEKVVKNAVAIAEQMTIDYPGDKNLKLVEKKLAQARKALKKEKRKDRRLILAGVAFSVLIVGGLGYFLFNHPKLFGTLLIMGSIKNFFYMLFCWIRLLFCCVI